MDTLDFDLIHHMQLGLLCSSVVYCSVLLKCQDYRWRLKFEFQAQMGQSGLM